MRPSKRRLHPESDRERDAADALDETMAAGRSREGSYAMEYRTIGITDGKERWIAVRGKVLLDSEGEAERYRGGDAGSHGAEAGGGGAKGERGAAAAGGGDARASAPL